MKRSVVVVQLLVTALFAAVGGFVAVSISGDAVDAERGGMTAAVPMMTEAQLRVGGVSASSDLATTTITPVRILDTREGAAALAGSKVPWGASETRTVEAAGLGTIPAGAVGVVVNVTVLNATASDTFLTLFPTGTSMPNASTINPQPNEVAFNAATVLLGGDDGTFEIYNYSGTVDVIIDVTAYMTRTLADAVDTVETDVVEVADDVGRLQMAQPLYPLRDVGGSTFMFSPPDYLDWVHYRLVDQSGLFGASIEPGRFSETAEIELRVAVDVPSSDEFELCFRIDSTIDGPIAGSEVCVDSETPESSDGVAVVSGPRVPLPSSGVLNLYVKIRIRDGATCPTDSYMSSCRGTMHWFGYYVYD